MRFFITNQKLKRIETTKMWLIKCDIVVRSTKKIEDTQRNKKIKSLSVFFRVWKNNGKKNKTILQEKNHAFAIGSQHTSLHVCKKKKIYTDIL